ncbi:hypothetical protein BGZ61DRAFT_457829 [Ilyonectria robusta]|uniref:uncharacterized protein n=1 Tax=Ilyonectria robusta TaxID=1079257 RepID=UPI001E8DF5DF|nr:uncharacterized protein BGZ61DRAFT_457829 [Ilyonectria robusta]KAH8677216.1 hypothetical protein BGZ61DRAFT_457829 [Ilyonectria robusta]
MATLSGYSVFLSLLHIIIHAPPSPLPPIHLPHPSQTASAQQPNKPRHTPITKYLLLFQVQKKASPAPRHLIRIFIPIPNLAASTRPLLSPLRLLFFVSSPSPLRLRFVSPHSRRLRRRRRRRRPARAPSNRPSVLGVPVFLIFFLTPFWRPFCWSPPGGRPLPAVIRRSR